jgi:hypothetical protein
VQGYSHQEPYLLIPNVKDSEREGERQREKERAPERERDPERERFFFFYEPSLSVAFDLFQQNKGDFWKKAWSEKKKTNHSLDIDRSGACGYWLLSFPSAS